MNRLLKKTARTILIVALAFGSLGTAQTSARAASANEWQKAYKKYIQDYLKSEDYVSGESYITLVDLDRDGSPELFAGRDEHSIQTMAMAYTFKKGKMLAIQEAGGHGYASEEGEFKTNFDVSISAFTEGKLKVFKHKKTGATVVTGTNGAMWSSVGFLTDYKFVLEGKILKKQEISSIYWDGYEYSYTIRGKKSSKSAYDQSRFNYYSSLQGISSGIKTQMGFENAKDIDKFLGIK